MTMRVEIFAFYHPIYLFLSSANYRDDGNDNNNNNNNNKRRLSLCTEINKCGENFL